MRKYTFHPELLGNVEEGRPNLGATVDIDVYRLMQFTLRDAIEAELGTEMADKLFYRAGKQAGVEFYHQHIGQVDSLDDFVRKTQTALREKRIGVLRIEEVKPEEGKIVLTVDEDLDCSGLPELDYEICVYDEGFVSGLLECGTGAKWTAKEIDCWCTGDRTCRFLAQRENS